MIKPIILALSAVLLSSFSSAASTPERLREPVVVPVMGFTAKVEGGRVIAQWRRYKRDDFFAYELLKTDKDTDPVYVAKKSVYATRGVGDLRYEDGQLAVGTWRYRLVIITLFGDVWVSPVVTLNIAEGDLHRPTPTAADFE